MTGDYQLMAAPTTNPNQHILIEQTRSEYADKQDLAPRPQRQAQSHRKEARFEYPALASGQQQMIYQTTNALSPNKDMAQGNFLNVNPSDPPRSKDLEVLRSAEQAAVMLSDAIPKSSSTVVKPSRSIGKDNQNQQKEA